MIILKSDAPDIVLLGFNGYDRCILSSADIWRKRPLSIEQSVTVEDYPALVLLSLGCLEIIPYATVLNTPITWLSSV